MFFKKGGGLTRKGWRKNKWEWEREEGLTLKETMWANTLKSSSEEVSSLDVWSLKHKTSQSILRVENCS